MSATTTSCWAPARPKPEEMAAFEQRARGSSSSPLQRGSAGGGGVDEGSSAHKGSPRREKERDKGKSMHPDHMDLNHLLSVGKGILQIYIVEGSLLCSHSCVLGTPFPHIRLASHIQLYLQYNRLIVEES